MCCAYFDELFFHLGFGGGWQISVLGEIGLEPARLLELDHTVDLGQLHPNHYVELEIEVVGDRVDLVEEAWQEFEIPLWETP